MHGRKKVNCSTLFPPRKRREGRVILTLHKKRKKGKHTRKILSLSAFPERGGRGGGKEKRRYFPKKRGKKGSSREEKITLILKERSPSFCQGREENGRGKHSKKRGGGKVHPIL